jgi:hypothetical protein
MTERQAAPSSPSCDGSCIWRSWAAVQALAAADEAGDGRTGRVLDNVSPETPTEEQMKENAILN